MQAAHLGNGGLSVLVLVKGSARSTMDRCWGREAQSREYRDGTKTAWAGWDVCAWHELTVLCMCMWTCY